MVHFFGQNDECKERCAEVLQTQDIPAIDKAKAHFRRAAALVAKGEHEDALKVCKRLPKDLAVDSLSSQVWPASI